jgi:hypothetical protein
MQDIHLGAIAVATIGAFILSGIWYGIFGKAMAALSTAKNKQADTMGPLAIAIEIARSAVVAVALAIVLAKLSPDTILNGAGYGLLLWAAFPVVLLVGSILHEKVRPKLAAIHAGDWLVKLIFMSALLTVWQ